MHAAVKLVRQRRIDHAMPFEPALSAERFRHDIETEVAFAAGPVAGMALMAVRFIFDMQAFGREGCCSFAVITFWVRMICSLTEPEALTSMLTARCFAACQVLKLPSTGRIINDDEIEFPIVRSNPGQARSGSPRARRSAGLPVAEVRRAGDASRAERAVARHRILAVLSRPRPRIQQHLQFLRRHER